MAEIRKCSECGTPLNSDAPEGFCPACMLRGAIDLGATGVEFPGSSAKRFGDYELLEEIARGGMGIVYRARQVTLDRIVALKLILLGPYASEASVRRFRAEAAAAAKLQHPNIVAIHEVGEQDAQPFFSMDYVAGRDLEQYAREHPFTARQAARLVQTVAEAIQYAHDHLIVHRDLKPSNLIIDQTGEPHITDFGLAKQLDRPQLPVLRSSRVGGSFPNAQLTLTGQVLGSPSFLPPEQASGKHGQVGPRTDVYALGAILYFLLTGRPPFAAETITDTLQEVLNQQPVAPRLLNRSVPRDLETICLKCLEKEPAKRYPSAQSLANELNRFLNGEPIHARPITAPDRFWRWCRRKPVAAGSAVAILLSLGLGLAGVLWQWRRAEASARREGRERVRAERAVTHLEMERAELLFEADNSGHALAYLSRILRREPTNEVAAERVLSALSQRGFCLPAGPPLRHQAPAKDWRDYGTPDYGEIPQALRHSGPICWGEFSPDGQQILTASKDGTAAIWDGTTCQRLRPPMRHDAEVVYAHFSPDGRKVVTASLDRSARIWNASTGQAITAPLRHQAAVLGAAFSSDGRRVVTASADKTARVWDSNTGEPLYPPLQHSNVVLCATFSPDGRWIATAAGYSAWLWDVHALASPARELKDVNKVRFVEFSPNSRTIVTGGYSWALRMWNVENGVEIFMREEHQSNLRSAQFSPDGTRLLTAGDESACRIRSAETGETLLRFAHDDAVASAQFSQEGHRVATGSADRTARIWEAYTGRPLTEPLFHSAPVSLVQFSPDAERLLTVTEGDMAWLWNIRGVTLEPQLTKPVRLYVARFSPNGERIISGGSDWHLTVRDRRTGREVFRPLRHGWHVQWAAYSNDGKRILTSDYGSAQLWNGETGELLFEAPPRKHGFAAALFSPDSKLFTAHVFDQSIGVWDTSTLKLVRVIRHGPEIIGASFSPDSKRLATCSKDQTARTWDPITGDSIGKPIEHQDTITSVRFSPDGKLLLTTSRDKTARVSDAVTAQRIFELKHDGPVDDARFDASGYRLLTRSGNAVRVWSALSGQAIIEPVKLSARINSAVFSPDGRRFLTASDDGTVRIWDSDTGQGAAEPMRHPGPVAYAEFSPDGRWVVSAAGSDKPGIWESHRALPPIPQWVPELAEAVGGQRFNSRNEYEPVPPEELLKIKERLLREGLESEYSRWAHWFCDFAAERRLSASAEQTKANLIGEYVEQHTVQTLRTAVTMSPRNAVAQARLAQLLQTNTNAGAFAEWNVLLRRAIQLGPSNVGVLSAVAEISLRSDADVEALRALEPILHAQPQNPDVLRILALQLEKQSCWRESYEALCRAADLGSDTNQIHSSLRAAMLLDRRRVLSRLVGPAQAQAQFLAAKGIPSRSPQAPGGSIDLSPYYNRLLNEDRHGQPGGFPTTLPSSLQSLDGTTFDVRGVIELAASQPGELPFPERVTIQIGRTCARSHFLHGTCHAATDGLLLGTYTVQYTNGLIEVIPIVYAEDVRESDSGRDVFYTTSRGKLAWSRRENGFARDRLYHSTWNNPHADVAIQTIQFGSSGKGFAPFLVAITIEP